MITSKTITEYLKTRPSNHNFNAHRKDLSALFQYAIDILEVIDRNPVVKIQKLPHSAKRKVIPKEKDIIKLFLAADPATDEKDLLTVLLHTLARIDEVLRLTWEDVNFEKWNGPKLLQTSTFCTPKIKVPALSPQPPGPY